MSDKGKIVQALERALLEENKVGLVLQQLQARTGLSREKTKLELARLLNENVIIESSLTTDESNATRKIYCLKEGLEEIKEKHLKERKYPDKIEVFISYAHEDEELKNILEKQLSVLLRQGILSAWSTRNIDLSDEWHNTIDEHLNSAQIVLLLISSDFIASDYCYGVEVERAMQRHESREAIVLPILLRPVYLKGAPFDKLEFLPSNAKPITSWASIDEAFINVKNGIRNAINRWHEAKQHSNKEEIIEKDRNTNESDLFEVSDGREVPNADGLLSYLANDGYFLNGHFKLVSGQHSDCYIQARIALMDEKIRKAFAIAMAQKLSKIKPTMLAASTVGGILLASETAGILGVPVLFGRQDADTMVWVNVEQFNQYSLKRVVLIDDVLTTGGPLGYSVQSLINLGAIIAAVVVAIDRKGGLESELRVLKAQYKISSLLELPLNTWDPDECPICPRSFINLNNPERDFLPVIFSMPLQKSSLIINGYRTVYKLQQNKEQLAAISQMEPLISIFLSNISEEWVNEHSGPNQFILLLYQDGNYGKKMLSELTEHMLKVSQINENFAPMSISFLIAEKEGLDSLLPIEHITSAKEIRTENLYGLIPYYNSFRKDEPIFMFNKAGELFGYAFRSKGRDIDLLKQETKGNDSIGLTLNRKLKTISAYKKGKLEAELVLSESGIWEFSEPDEEENQLERYARSLNEFMAKDQGKYTIDNIIDMTGLRRATALRLMEHIVNIDPIHFKLIDEGDGFHLSFTLTENEKAEEIFRQAKTFLARGDYPAAYSRLLEIPKELDFIWERIKMEFSFAFNFDKEKEAQFDWENRRGQIEWRRKVWGALATDEVSSSENESSIAEIKEAIREETAKEVTNLRPEDKGKALEEDTLRLLRHLFTFDKDDVSIPNKLRKQRGSSQLGCDIKLEFCRAANNQNVRCLVECKSHEGELPFPEILQKLYDAKKNQTKIDHWILIAPRAKNLGNVQDQLVEEWNINQEFPFKVQFWTKDNEVWRFFGLEPDVYERWIDHPKGEKHPREWAEKEREKVKNLWLSRLDPPQRLPRSWANYVTDESESGLFIESDDRKCLRDLWQKNQYIPPGALDSSHSPLSSSLSGAVQSWLNENTTRACLILGDFGDGKTSFTYMLARELIAEYKKNPNKGWIPLRFPLYRFARPNFNARDFLRDRLEELVHHNKSF